MEKLSISKLIANDVVNYGMDKTTSFNYIVSLNDFLDEYDDESRDYIKSHITEIIDAVHQNENVAQLDYDEKRQEFDMVFFFDNLMSPLEKRIMDTGKNMGIDYELDDVRTISYDIENSDEYDDLITSSIKNHDLGREM